MHLYRADAGDAAQLQEALRRENLLWSVEDFGPDAIYIMIKSSRPDIAALARAAGRSVRRIVPLDQLDDDTAATV